MNRRRAIAAMGATIACGLKGANLSSASVQATSSSGADKPASSETEKALQSDLTRMTSREYSEEGVPVFLACEDLASVFNKTHPGNDRVDAFNAKLAGEMRRNAVAWQHLRPDAPASDVGKMIEVIADRDFAAGGSETLPDPPELTFTDTAESVAEAFAANPVIRAVNFHNTSRAQAAVYERQLEQYSRHFSSVSQNELENYLVTGKWLKAKPGLIVSVFEGYRNSYDVLLPIIEKYGFIGWFFMITSFINSPVAEQRDFAEHHDIDMLTHEYADGRYAMDWDELRKIDRKHVIASHTRSHTLLAGLDPETQRKEVIGSQEDLKKNLGHPVRAFVSLTGPPYGDNAAVDHLIDEAGYDLVFSNYRIQRIRGR